MNPRAALVLLALSSCTAGRPATPDPVLNGRIAQAIDRFMRDSLPTFSGQMLVALGGRVVLHEAYGLADRESGRRNTVETVFDIGSVTKQFTAAALLALVQDGRVSVTDTLGKFFPTLRTPKAGVTLHQLLTHSSGLPQYSGDDYEPLTSEGLLRWLDTVSLEFVPGEHFRYSNPGYSLIALVVERASGMPFERFVQSRLLHPAGLRWTGYRTPSWQNEKLAVGYTPSEGRVGSPLDRFWQADGPSWNLRGNGGMLSTAADLYRWQHALVSGRVLSQETVQRLTAGYIDTGRPNRSYGYGWYVGSDDRGRRLVDHTGGNGAFFAMVRWYQEPEVVLVVTSNAFQPEVIRDVLAALVRCAVGPARAAESPCGTLEPT